MTDRAVVRVPHENVNDESATINQWLVADGSQVTAGQSLAVMESSKTTFEVAAPVAGIVRYTHAVGAEVPIGAELCTVGSADDGAIPMPIPIRTASEWPAPGLSPSARRLVAQGGVDPASIVGTGRGGHIVKQDLLKPIDAETFAEPRFSQASRKLLDENGLDAAAFAGRGLVQARDVLALVGQQSDHTGESHTEPSTDETDGQLPFPTPAVDVPFRTEPLSRAKRTEVKYLQRGQAGVLASAVSVLVPTKGLRSAASTLPGGLTALIAFETARLLRKYPIFNACFADGVALIYEPVNIGVAMDADRGLKVPVIHNTDDLTVPEVGRKLEDLLIAYADDKLPAKALSGGTFTVTDLSSEGAFGLAPLMNQGQSAILGVGGEVELSGGRVFQLILAFDHRLAEGRRAAQFLGDLHSRLAAHEAALGLATVAAPACSRCGRTMDQLTEFGAFLLHAYGPDRKPAGVCSICLAGW